ncbi:hypothetical protein [Vibrio harveyi]|uniref:hypothetical protein n=1 Tax=Vibrio harveyi TaxID=669 RepID=UPI003CF6DAF6
MSEIENFKVEFEAMAKRVIMLEQFINSATRSEPAGTTTVGALTNISDSQLEDNPLFYVEHADGGLNVYLSQIIAQAQKDIDAGAINKGELDPERLPKIPATKVPAAISSASAGSGFGGFRYILEGTTLKLFVS